MKSIRILLAFTALAVVLTAAEPLTNENIIRMVQSGVPADLIIKTIRTADTFQFGLLPGDLIALGQAKVPEEVIKAMAAKLNAATPATQPAVQTAALPAPIAERPNLTGGEKGARNTGVGSEGLARPEIYRAEIFGGYSYLNVDTNGATSRQSLNGWESSATVNVNKLFGVEGDFSGYYKTNILGSGIGAHDYILAGGPRISFRPVFFHALVGMDHLTGSALGVSVSQNSFAALFGGGVELRIARGWAVRPSADYLLSRHGLSSRVTQNSIRVGGGIVYSFGRL